MTDFFVLTTFNFAASSRGSSLDRAVLAVAADRSGHSAVPHAMPRTHFPNPANMGTTQELLDIQQTVRALADQLDRIERSAGKPRGPPRGARPTATLQAITIGGVQQPFFSGDQLGPLCFETLDVEQQFFEQLHAREADAAGGAARAAGITHPCTPLRTPSHTPHPRRR